MAYADIQKFIDFYGEDEAICLTDKAQPRTKAVNPVRLQMALDRACAEIDQSLSCCGFDMRACKETIASGTNFPILCHWNLVVARYLLYDTIRLSANAGGSDHEAHRRYKDYEEEIRECCSQGTLVDENGLAHRKTVSSFAVAGMDSCLPDSLCCCGKKNCCCSKELKK